MEIIIPTTLFMALVALRIEGIIISSKQRRRIKTEEKAKVVAAVCGTDFIQQDVLEKVFVTFEVTS